MMDCKQDQMVWTGPRPRGVLEGQEGHLASHSTSQHIKGDIERSLDVRGVPVSQGECLEGPRGRLGDVMGQRGRLGCPRGQ